MAITKRLHVSFDLKIVAPTEEVEEFTQMLLTLSRDFLNGVKLTGLQAALARAAAEGGVESAMELFYKSEMQEFIREELRNSPAHPSNIRVEVVR